MKKARFTFLPHVYLEQGASRGPTNSLRPCISAKLNHAPCSNATPLH